jgi:SAM-dependent methyltransferase
MIETVVRWAVCLGLMVYVGRQVRKPTKWFGRLVARGMNESHSALTDWALGHVPVGASFSILDVGCGGGRTVSKLAAMAPSGVVHGVDYAEGSVAASRAHNARLIQDGRVKVEKASVSQLPFQDRQFDLVTAIETQYYWPDLRRDLREILRVLKPHGKLVIVAESYKGARNDWLLGPFMRLLGSSHLSADDQRALFSEAGFDSIEIFEERKKSWICIVGARPVSDDSGQ